MWTAASAGTTSSGGGRAGMWQGVALSVMPTLLCSPPLLMKRPLRSSMTVSSEPDKDNDDDVMEIDCDWPCWRCRYNLRGADVKGMCPECGASIAQSLTKRPGPRVSNIIEAAIVAFVLLI